MSLRERTSAKLLAERARRRLRAGDVAGALKAARRALREDEACIEAHLARTEALLRTGNPQAALAATDQMPRCTDAAGAAAAPAGHAGSPERDRRRRRRRSVLRAEALRRLGCDGEAEMTLQDAVALDPTEPAAVIPLAAQRIEAGDPAGALAVLGPAREAHPADARIAELMAEAYEAAERWGEAFESWRSVERLVGADAAQRLHTARLALLAGRVGPAEQRFRDLVEAHPDDAELFCEAAEAATALSDDAIVLARLHAALETDPGHPRARLRLGEQHLRCGRFRKAGACFARQYRRASRPGGRWIDPAPALAGLTVSALCRQRRAAAERALHRLESLCEPDRQAALMEALWQAAVPGRLLRQTVEGGAVETEPEPIEMLLGEAADTLAEAAQRKPTYADLHYHHAVCRRELGEADAAAESLDWALAINDGYLAAARARLGLFLRRGDLDAARALVDSVAARKPDSAQVVLMRCALRAAGGDPRSAVTELTEQIGGAQARAIADEVTSLLTGAGHDRTARRWHQVCRARGVLPDEAAEATAGPAAA